MSIWPFNKKEEIMKSGLSAWKKKYLSRKPGEIILGENSSGKIKFDLSITPHWIIAGDIGRGKSVTLRLIAFQCLLKKFRTIIMDFKNAEDFSGIYKDFCDVITDKKMSVEALQALVDENAKRRDIFRETCCRNIDDYNRRFPDKQMERIVILIEECDLLLMSTREIEDKELTDLATTALEKLAILAKGAGINIVICTLRPDAYVLTSRIKSVFLGRLCGYYHDQEYSLMVLNNTKANELPRYPGWFVIQDLETSLMLMFQRYYFPTHEIVKMLDEIRSKSA